MIKETTTIIDLIEEAIDLKIIKRVRKKEVLLKTFFIESNIAFCIEFTDI